MKTAELQELFLTSLQDPGISSESLFTPILNLNRKQCLEIYRKGYKARLTESLGSTFEACWWVLGDESYFQVAEDYLRGNPSQTYDLSDYGESFPDFLKTHSESQEIPFIFDLAKFEWLFKTVFHSANLVSGLNVSAVTEDSLLKLNPLAALFSSEFAVYEIWKNRTESIEVLGDVPWENPAFYLLFRRDGKIYVRAMEAEAFQLLKIFENGQSLSHAVDLISVQFPEITESRVGEIFSSISEFLILK